MKLTFDNTDCTIWFERDRAHVRLSDNFGCEDTILELWDEQVAEFIQDGFKTDKQTWHEALLEYANERGIDGTGRDVE